MSILKDFNELHVSFKNVIIGIALIMPFWYLDLYLFYKPFFFNNQFYIPIVAAFCLSVCWYGINIFSATCLSEILFGESKNDGSELFIAAVLSVMFIALSSLLGRYDFFKSYTFVIFAFSTNTAFAICAYIRWLVFQARNNKKGKK